MYNSLFVSHINYGSLDWSINIIRLSGAQKKINIIIMQSHHIALTEPPVETFGIIERYFIRENSKMKCMHKLSHNDLPLYFQQYQPYLRFSRCHFTVT